MTSDDGHRHDPDQFDDYEEEEIEQDEDTPPYARRDVEQKEDFNPIYDSADTTVRGESEPAPWGRRVVHSVPYYIVVMSLIPAACLWMIVTHGNSPALTAISALGTAFGILTVSLRLIRGSVLERFTRVRERIKYAAELTDPVTGTLLGIKPSYRLAQHLWEEEVALWETKQHQLSVVAKAIARLKKLVSTTFRKVLTSIATLGLFIYISNNRPLGITLAVALVVGFIVYSIADWSADRYALTDQRVMAVVGLITEGQPAMPRARITDINALVTMTAKFLSWLGWIELPYGTLIFESAGGDQALREIFFVPCAMAVSAALKMAKTPG